MAIDRAIWIALGPRRDGRVVAHALDLHDVTDFPLTTLQNTNEGWAEYLKGVAWSLQEATDIPPYPHRQGSAGRRDSCRLRSIH